MSKIKVLMLSMLAVFAIGAIASATASALVWEACLEGNIVGTKYEDSNCTKELTTGKFGWMPIEKTLNVTATGGTQLLELETNPQITITCTGVESKGNIQTGGKDEITKLEYKGCTINIAGCTTVKTKGKANGTIEVAEVLATQLSTLTKESKLLVVDLVKPSAGTVFVKLEIGKKENAKGEAEGACGVLPVKPEVKGETQAMTEGNKLIFQGEGSLTTAGINSKYLGITTQTLENGFSVRASS